MITAELKNMFIKLGSTCSRRTAKFDKVFCKIQSEVFYIFTKLTTMKFFIIFACLAISLTGKI